jgi:thiopurine S-methyltransferase
MEPKFWLERWQQGQIGFHQAEINAHLQEFWGRLQLPLGSPVFVPLCGKSRDLLWLRGQGHPVLGVEISPLAVQDFFREHQLAPSIRPDGFFERYESDGLVILCGDFFAMTPAQLAAVAGVYDRASLIALPAALRARYAAHLQQLLPARTETLLITLEYPDAEMEGPPFSVRQAEVERLYAGRYAIAPIYAKDVLAENARFREQGLTGLVERVYRLRPRD